MSQQERRGTWKSIKFDRFQEDPLPSGRVLLHCFFRDKWGNSYKWTPPWKDVERVFFKALEIEEVNEPEGVWDEELKKVSQKLPSLKAFKLPVKICCSTLEDLEEDPDYSITIEILGEEEEVKKVENNFRIGNCVISFANLISTVSNIDTRRDLRGDRPYNIGISRPTALRSVVRHHNVLGYIEEEGISFEVGLEKGMEQLEYVTASREIVMAIRSYIRKVLSDFGAIKEGFEGGEE